MQERDLHVPLALVTRQRLDTAHFAIEVAEDVVYVGTIQVTGDESRFALEVLIFEDDTTSAALSSLQFDLRRVRRVPEGKIDRKRNSHTTGAALARVLRRARNGRKNCML